MADMKLALVAVVAAASLRATPTLTYLQTANDAIWQSAPSGYNTNSYEYIPGATGSYGGRQGYGFYDAFRIQAQGGANEVISSLTISFRFSGLFDDSVALDLNGDGSIDYTVSWDNLAISGPHFPTPWSSLEDAGNLGIVLTITDSGTTAQSYLYGYTVATTQAGYVNSLAGITLTNLGLKNLDASGAAISNGSMRVGFLNRDGFGGGTPSVGEANFNYDPNQTYPVPEPSTYGLALGGLALVGALIRRRKASK